MYRKIKLLLAASITVAATALSGCDMMFMNATPPKGYDFHRGTHKGILAFSVGCNLGDYSYGQIQIGTPSDPFLNTNQTHDKFSCMTSLSGNRYMVSYVSYTLPAGMYFINGWVIQDGGIEDSFNRPFVFNVEKNKVNYIGRIELIQGYNGHYEMIITNHHLHRDFKYFYHYFPSISHAQYRFVRSTQKKINSWTGMPEK